MELKYVGDMPIVSQHGIMFDHTQVDKYVYLDALLELLEALSYGATQTTQHLYKSEHKRRDAKEILSGLKKYIKNLDEISQQREQKVLHLVEDLKRRVNENTTLNDDERAAWLNNIDIMVDYYLQYVTNESVYNAALDALGDEIAEAKVQEVQIPMFRNYGIILRDLQKKLETRKSPIDSKVEVTSTSDGIVGTIYFFHR